jgi:hypothetical protein
MIAQHTFRTSSNSSETIFSLVARLARGASNGRLAALLGMAVAGALLLIAFVPFLWPVAALGGALGSIALWGLLDHRAVNSPSRILTLAQPLLVVVAAVFASGAILGIWFALLGPRWML